MEPVLACDAFRVRCTRLRLTEWQPKHESVQYRRAEIRNEFQQATLAKEYCSVLYGKARTQRMSGPTCPERPSRRQDSSSMPGCGAGHCTRVPATSLALLGCMAEPC